MLIRILCAACVLLVLGNPACRAQGQSLSAALRPVVDRLARASSPDQLKQITGALQASPQLVRQLDDLAASGRLTDIRIVPPSASTLFKARIAGTTMVIEADFLASLAQYRGMRLVHETPLLPNNTVYCLGHLAWHMAHKDPDPRLSPSMEDFMRRKLTVEAGAYIQGYNDVVDAALQANGRQKLSERQMLPFLTSSYTRDALGPAAMSADGTIAVSPDNVSKVAARLQDLNVQPIE